MKTLKAIIVAIALMASTVPSFAFSVEKYDETFYEIPRATWQETVPQSNVIATPPPVVVTPAEKTNPWSIFKSKSKAKPTPKNDKWTTINWRFWNNDQRGLDETEVQNITNERTTTVL